MKIPEESELIAMLDKTEKEQLRSLQNMGVMVIRPETNESFDYWWESLPDLAERLWEKAKPRLTVHILAMVFNFEDEENLLLNWIRDAKPIHRIVASLIALKRAGVEI